MIDITVYDNRVEIENKIYTPFLGQEEVIRFIKDLLDKAKYSGEHMILRKRVWVDMGNECTENIEQW